ncbi:unnamed protein product, partial [Tetraodon nigroviridis]
MDQVSATLALRAPSGLGHGLQWGVLRLHQSGQHHGALQGRTSLARPGVVNQGAAWRRRAEEDGQAGRPRERVPEQALQSQPSGQSVRPAERLDAPLTALSWCSSGRGSVLQPLQQQHPVQQRLQQPQRRALVRRRGESRRGLRHDSADPDPDALNKGGSNDSGIDSSTPYNNARHGNMPGKNLHGFAGYSGMQELSVGRSGGGGDARRRESSPVVPAAANQNKGYRTRTFPPPGSSADKMDAFKPRAYTPQGYKTPTAEKARPVRAATTTPTSAQLSSSAPKAFYGKSRPTAWLTDDAAPSPSGSTKTHVDANSKNVFGQPRLRASLRDLRSPRRTYKSTIEDDLKKLIIMDSPGDTPQRDPVRTP